MERYLLDTNVALFAVSEQIKEIDRRVTKIVSNYENLFYVSTVSVREIIHLCKRGKIRGRWKTAEDILPSIEAMGYEILPVKREHLVAYARLEPLASHNDPNDHMIISQAIAEKLTLISSDRKFEPYIKQKLKFIFNER
ncbi:MAG: type II toxin-antitoxin system VapC family toxin [Prevotellaceae bacterium]|jgi:PIN domain nuclease of toxin-antitoxin system|nr:type II toxin-antitoxin system VapC family toxin [Prevotellaceae bacterium]